MNLGHRIYRTEFKPVNLTNLDIEIQRECFLFAKSIKSIIIDDYEYFILNAIEYDKLKELEELTGVKHDLEDISEIVLYAPNTLPGIIDKDSYNEFIFEFELLEKNTDIVLDKIRQYGIESLSAYDKQVLENH